MNIYLISVEEHSWDEYDSAVVAAPSAEAAKKIQPAGGDTPTYGWPTDPDCISVKYLGVAARDTVAGVILGSFNAG